MKKKARRLPFSNLSQNKIVFKWVYAERQIVAVGLTVPPLTRKSPPTM